MPDAQVVKLLKKSAAQYQALRVHAEQLGTLLDGAEFSQVRDYVALLQEMQGAASEMDEQLLPIIEADIERWGKHPEYQLRQQSITAILELNELLLPRIRGMMAVTSAELEQLRDGRVAMVGYAAQQVDRRGLRGVG